jgi:hypothetical protein
MKAINLPHYKMKLRDVSRNLYLEHGWKMPPGLMDRRNRNPLNFSREEWQQSRRAGLHPKEIKRAFQESWAASDNRKAFAQALLSKGFVLARGDRRGYVVLDYRGEVYAVARYAGVKTKDVRKRLGDPKELPSIDQTKSRSQRLSHGLIGIWRRLTGKHEKIQRQNEMDTLVSYQRDRKEKDEVIFQHIQQRQRLSLRQQSETHTHELEIELLRQGIRDYDSMRTDKHSRLREGYREISESPERPHRAKQDQDREEDRGYEPEI